ncbi:LacI family DNA-binding transcriptional regulator [Microbacterium excoecariae]|uniref:LacI family DNA-binding transcriptional regulator n=1 Tax=Microbacterium excoecariae TaxID=2715210 RepID=UPI0014087AF9|nr:LacI family DNA-binding transcriptional regulator [Microbacterium excoecariae]NHI15758.1 LacI family transcriptional regulator [Microbacterium excoecariae]
MSAAAPLDRPTMGDVAERAGVSKQTVSRFFTGRGYVGDDTRARIAEAIDDLGYRRNQTASNLRLSRTDTIGVLALGGLVYGSAELLTGLSRAARDVEFTLVITQLDLDLEAVGWEPEALRAIDRMLSSQVDGIVLSTPVQGEERLLEVISPLPTITVSERPHVFATSVGTDSRAAGYLATRHLLDLGHERVVHVAGPRTRNEARGRAQGYRDAMAERGLPARVVEGARDWGAGSGQWAAVQLRASDFTAVVTANDEIALGFLSEMRARGLVAPRDFSIVGVDDMPIAAHFSPALTTMRMDFRSMGEEIFRMLHAQITRGEQPSHRTFPPTLIERASTAPPGAA